MERDIIVLYIIAGVSFSFALFNCILFTIKYGKTMKTNGTIVLGTPIIIRYDRKQPERIYSYSAKRVITGFLIGIGSVLIAVFMQIH